MKVPRRKQIYHPSTITKRNITWKCYSKLLQTFLAHFKSLDLQINNALTPLKWLVWGLGKSWHFFVINNYFAHIVLTTAQQVISCHWKDENGSTMYEKWKIIHVQTTKAKCLFVKDANLWHSHCCSSHNCLSYIN